MAHNDAQLDGRYKKPHPIHTEVEEAGVTERANQQLSQGNRSFYAGAFDGSTPVGAKKGNLPGPMPDAGVKHDDSTGGQVPFTNLKTGR